MRSHRVFVCLGILLSLLAGAMYYYPNHNKVRNEKSEVVLDFSKAPASIFDYDDAVFAAYEHPVGEHQGWLKFPDDAVMYYQNYYTNERKYSPFLIGSLIVRNLLNYDRNGRTNVAQLDECVAHMEKMKEIFDKHGKFPWPAYQIMGDGWVSSMDAPTIMVGSRMLYEITKDEKWHDFVKALSAYVVRDIQGGGFNFRLDEEAVWPLEYAEKDIPYDKAYFVLNGSLSGLVGMLIVAEVEQDVALKAFLERVEKGYTKMLPEFPYNNYTWTKYMLHPATVNQPHYVFFEWSLFLSLTHLTENPLFKSELEFRTACLKSVLKPQFKQMNGKNLFIIHRACAPHPYLIDCYPSKIVFYDANNQELGEYKENRSGSRGNEESFKAGEFLVGEVPQGAARYAYFRDDLGYEIFGGEIGETSDFANDSDGIHVCGYTLQSENDAQMHGGDIRIANDLSGKEEGTLIFKLHDAETLDEHCYYGIEIDNLTGKELYCGLIIRDSHQGAGRYYTPLETGKNLVLFNILGFENIDTIRLNDIRRIDLRLYTNTVDVDGTCSVGRLLRFNDLFDLREYRMTADYEIPLQK